ncbi:MAG: hypothetical protein IIA83_08040 [Thaumarchaeota archaeon]|nr:hypothetical protein [Nitrososphaerota archaeon]
MSKDTYLKGEKKEKALEKIRTFIAYRMRDNEILSNLKKNGIEISERTLRRYKLEIQEKAGSTATEIFKNLVINDLAGDIFTLQELQRESWRVYNDATEYNEKIRALTLLRHTTHEKFKIFDNVRVYIESNIQVKTKDTDERLDNSGGD